MLEDHNLAIEYYLAGASSFCIIPKHPGIQGSPSNCIRFYYVKYFHNMDILNRVTKWQPKAGVDDEWKICKILIPVSAGHTDQQLANGIV